MTRIERAAIMTTKFPLLLKIAAGILFIGMMIYLGAVYLPMGIDWRETYRPVGLAVLHGQSPYSVEGFRIAPWAALATVPFAWLPEQVGRSAYLIFSFLAFAFVPYRLGAKPLALSAYLLSPPVLHCLLNGNIDWLPLLGFVMPPWLGLFFVTIKPQIGIGVGIYWFVSGVLDQGWRQTMRTFLPVGIAMLASFAIWGLWLSRFSAPLGYYWNASLWPASIPVGLVLLVTAVRQRKIEYAMASSPCLSPYVLLHSWAGVMVALSRLPYEMLAANIGLWVLVILQARSGAL